MALGATIVLSACDENLTLSCRDIGENGVFQYAQVSNTIGYTGGNQSPRLAWKHAPAASKGASSVGSLLIWSITEYGKRIPMEQQIKKSRQRRWP
jgi:hypothetical protein